MLKLDGNMQEPGVYMINRRKGRAGWILLVIFVLILSIGFFFSDLKIQLLDLPALEAKKQSVIPIISTLTTNDTIIEENHYPLRKAPFCLWSADFWTYKSSRNWSEMTGAFDLSFASWTKLSPPSGTYYNNGSLSVGIEWKSNDSNAGNTYIVRLYIDEPFTPQCGPD